MESYKRILSIIHLSKKIFYDSIKKYRKVKIGGNRGKTFFKSGYAYWKFFASKQFEQER